MNEQDDIKIQDIVKQSISTITDIEKDSKKIIQITRYGTVLIASLQSTGMAVFLSSASPTIAGPVVPDANFAFYFVKIKSFC